MTSSRFTHYLLAVMLAVMFMAPPSLFGQKSPAANDAYQLTDSGLFQVRFESEISPIIINKIHYWLLHLRTINGEAVLNAEIVVAGGMPEHDHGLPTKPRTRPATIEGDYLIEGLRFHMRGRWELELIISAAGATDTLTVYLDL